MTFATSTSPAEKRRRAAGHPLREFPGLSFSFFSATLVLFVLCPGLAYSREPATRTFTATYVGTIAPLPEGAKRAEVWIPLPSNGTYQTVSDVKVVAPFPTTMHKDATGNAMAHGVIENPPAFADREFEVRATYTITRAEAVSPELSVALASSSKTPEGLGEYLKPNKLVPLTPRVRYLAAQLSAGRTDPVAKARAFYDYLVDNGTYDKTTPGWGKGDSERFCDVKKGNCTDFHSAFMALARSERIPVRFFIGFPLKPEKEGTVPGYHCWAEFWAPNLGWIPVDASDAAKTKEPAKKAYLFGNLDPDRFDITTGRDLTLSPAQKGGPVNFFIYPYVEVDGKVFTQTNIMLEYRDL
jgi:transglutaminase-like putative cysteine protease